MERLIYLAAAIVVFACIGAMIIASNNFKKLWASYRGATAWLDYCDSFVRIKESLLRKNKGDDPWGIVGDIPYVDYVGELDFFLGSER